MANNSKYTPTVRYPRSYIVETDQGAHLRRNRRYLQAIAGRQTQTAVATPTVLSNPEADARTPMTIHPPLLHSGSTLCGRHSRRSVVGGDVH